MTERKNQIWKCSQKTKLFLLTLILVGSTFAALHPMVAGSNLEVTATTMDNETLNVFLTVKNINQNTSIPNASIPWPLYNITEQVYLQNSTGFETVLWQNLNNSFVSSYNMVIDPQDVLFDNENLALSLNFSLHGAISKTNTLVPPQTRVFNPLTWLFEIVDRSTTLALNDTYTLQMNWITVSVSGEIPALVSISEGTFNYSLDFSEVLDFSALSAHPITSWNITQEGLSADYEDATSHVTVSIHFPVTARNFYTSGSTVIYQVPVIVAFPFTVMFGIIGIVIFGLGFLLYFIRDTSDVETGGEFGEKWKDRYKKKQRKR
ncbi:MAG: hypothetical protein ACW976_00205 [Candidatus Ranarchaeia archaeon]|jgi:hypothetical protein